VSDSEVITNEVARRYARALYALAVEAKSLKTIEKDVKALRAIFSGNAELQRVMNSPVFATQDKITALIDVAKKAKASKLMTQFIGTATENRRSEDIIGMLAAFEDLAARHRGAVIAKVTSAQKLTSAQLSALKTQLKKTVLADSDAKASGAKTVDIETEVDPDLLGGFVVRVGSRLFDSSLKTRLEDLKLALKEA